MAIIRHPISRYVPPVGNAVEVETRADTPPLRLDGLLAEHRAGIAPRNSATAGWTSLSSRRRDSATAAGNPPRPAATTAGRGRLVSIRTPSLKVIAALKFLTLQRFAVQLRTLRFCRGGPSSSRAPSLRVPGGARTRRARSACGGACRAGSLWAITCSAPPRRRNRGPGSATPPGTGRVPPQGQTFVGGGRDDPKQRTGLPDRDRVVTTAPGKNGTFTGHGVDSGRGVRRKPGCPALQRLAAGRKRQRRGGQRHLPHRGCLRRFEPPPPHPPPPPHDNLCLRDQRPRCGSRRRHRALGATGRCSGSRSTSVLVLLASPAAEWACSAARSRSRRHCR